jgi:transketolase
MTLSNQENKKLQGIAARIRCTIVDITSSAGGSHIGGALSQTDILTLLYFKYLKIDPSKPRWEDRDRFVLSKGHGGVGLVAVLANRGYFSPDIFNNYGKKGSWFSMHMNAQKVPGVDISTGSLGHGLSQAVGLAMGARYLHKPWRTYCLVGDGECHEGSIWEAAMAAHHFKLDNLTAVVDRNMMCVDGRTEDVMSLEPLADKWAAFGWKVKVVNGHSFSELATAFDFALANKEGPVVVIANTIKGKGYHLLENDPAWHYGSLDSGKVEEAKRCILGVQSD